MPLGTIPRLAPRAPASTLRRHSSPARGPHSSAGADSSTGARIASSRRRALLAALVAHRLVGSAAAAVPIEHRQGRDHRRARRRARPPPTARTPTRPTPRRSSTPRKVTKVYSPNATWSKVKAAVAGANIVIYFGHGNGWPSPYTYDPNVHDEGRLRPEHDLNGDGNLSDNEHKYYGEPYMAQLGLAPNAIVLLGNLCYASGNSEPGGTAPSGQRRPPAGRQLRRRLPEGRRPGRHRRRPRRPRAATSAACSRPARRSSTCGARRRTTTATRPASRRPGRRATRPSPTPTRRRAATTARSSPKPTMTTTRRHEGRRRHGRRSGEPGRPGPRRGRRADAPLLASATGRRRPRTRRTLPEGTRLKTIAVATPATVDTPAMIQVEGLDDPTLDGYVQADHLAPKDSRAPVLIGIDSGAARFSPNGDGQSDTQTVGALFSETVDWTFDVHAPGGAVIATQSGSGSSSTAAWDGLVGGAAVADGTYSWTLRGTDAWQNGVATGTGTIVVDTTAPVDQLDLARTAASSTSSARTATGSRTRSPRPRRPEAGSLAVRGRERVRHDGPDVQRARPRWARTASRGTGRARRERRPRRRLHDHDRARDAAGNTGAGASRTVRVVDAPRVRRQLDAGDSIPRTSTGSRRPPTCRSSWPVRPRSRGRSATPPAQSS